MKHSLRDSLEAEIKMVRNSTTFPFIVHCIKSSDAFFDDMPLKKLEKFSSDVPILVIACSETFIKAKCFVPKVNFIIYFRMISESCLASIIFIFRI